MNKKRRPPLAWVALSLLAALVATNLVFLALLRTSGPLIGVVFYMGLLLGAWRKRQPDCRPAMVGGLIGLAVHIVEVILVGWTAYPLLMALNLALPAALALVAWLAGREV